MIETVADVPSAKINRLIGFTFNLAKRSRRGEREVRRREEEVIAVPRVQDDPRFPGFLGDEEHAQKTLPTSPPTQHTSAVELMEETSVRI